MILSSKISKMNILDYIKGDKKGKQAQQIEKQAMQDPFLADAIDGFESVEGNHVERVEKLEKRINERTASTNNKKGNNWWMYVAAVALILVIIGSFFTLLDQSPVPQIADVILMRDTLNIYAPVEKQETPIIASNKQAEKLKEKVLFTTPIVTEEDLLLNDYLSVADAVIHEETLSVAAETPVQRTIKGKVTDKYGEGLPGAVVSVRGTSQGTTADTDGNYTIALTQEKNEIVASYAGMEPESIKNPQAFQNIALNESNRTLSEAVISRSETQRKTMSSALEEKVAGIQAEGKESEPLIGNSAYKKYLKDNLISPTDDCAGKKGTVVVAFFVDSSGTPTNIFIQKSLCSSSDKEAIRLVKEGSKWTSSLNGLVKVEVQF